MLEEEVKGGLIQEIEVTSRLMTLLFRCYCEGVGDSNASCFPLCIYGNASLCACRRSILDALPCGTSCGVDYALLPSFCFNHCTVQAVSDNATANGCTMQL